MPKKLTDEMIDYFLALRKDQISLSVSKAKLKEVFGVDITMARLSQIGTRAKFNRGAQAPTGVETSDN